MESDRSPRDPQQVVLPLVEEQAEVGKRTVVKDTVRVRTKPAQKQQAVRETLTHCEVDVQRVPVGREVEKPPAVRTEGDVTVFPVLEERLVLRKQLILTAEVRVRLQQREETFEDAVTLRSTDVEIERGGQEHSRKQENGNG